ncbi:hypothetical protein ANN_15741 [Periplaneta americana]|uniref:Uncharacterized protein n=1 Tax=Periplaneta americana TaxID=6978 RepID=A0ABQ8SH18_PERAM|nr:hypothetical protein ANN_15741 [Periplaneta americana]
MVGLCKGGNEPSGSLKAVKNTSTFHILLLRSKNLISMKNCASESDSVKSMLVYCFYKMTKGKHPYRCKDNSQRLKMTALTPFYIEMNVSYIFALHLFAFGRCYICEDDNAGEMNPGSNTESYPAFAHIGLRENPGKNLNQVTCPDRKSNPGHLVSRLDALTVTPQTHITYRKSQLISIKIKRTLYHPVYRTPHDKIIIHIMEQSIVRKARKHGGRERKWPETGTTLYAYLPNGFSNDFTVRQRKCLLHRKCTQLRKLQICKVYAIIRTSHIVFIIFLSSSCFSPSFHADSDSNEM